MISTYIWCLLVFIQYTTLPKKGLNAGLKVQRSILHGKLDLKGVYPDTALSLAIWTRSNLLRNEENTQ